MSGGVVLRGGEMDGRVLQAGSYSTVSMPFVGEHGIYSAVYRRSEEDRADLDHYQWLDVCPACDASGFVERPKRDGTGKVKQRKCLDCHGFGTVSVRSSGAPGSGQPVERERYAS